MRIVSVAFFGHRYVQHAIQAERLLEGLIRNRMEEKEYVNFLVGRNGDFDHCVASSVRRLQRKYRNDNSALVLVLPYLTAEYQNNESSFHDYDTDVEIFPAASKAHPKSAIGIRNREMVDRADLVVCYLERKKGGAWQTIAYAKKQGKPILNLWDRIIHSPDGASLPPKNPPSSRQKHQSLWESAPAS